MCDTALANCNNANGAYSFWSQDFMYTGGIAMSPDDTKVFYTTATQIFYISAVGAVAGNPVAVGAPLSGTSQYRGISWAPVTPTCGAGVGGSCCTPGMPGYYCAGGVLPLLPCPAGSTSLLGGGLSLATGCTQCTAGTYSASLRGCAACSAGIACAGTGNAVNTVPCAPGFYCPGGVAPIACTSGIYCNGGAKNNTVVCPPGMFCVSGQAPAACPAGTASALTSQTSAAACSNCTAGYGSAAGSAACSVCAAGSYSAAPGGTPCAFCSPGIWCPQGSTSNSQVCPAGWYCTGGNRGVTAQCNAGTYSAATGASSNATCTNCGAGFWCPVGSTNTSVPCPAGWACPGGGAPNVICGPGYFSANTGSTSCTLCQAGSLSSVYGATSCQICPAGQYIEAGAANLVCSVCPANTYQPNVGAGSRAFCLPCPGGYSSQPGATSCSAATWSKGVPGSPLTGRSSGVALANASAFVAVGGITAAGASSPLSLGIDAFTGQMVESPAVNVSFNQAAQAPHPTDGSVFVYGGLDASGNALASLWRVQSQTNGLPLSARMSFPASPAPSARFGAGMAYLSSCAGLSGSCLVLIGGQLGASLLGDVWIFDLVLNTWSQPAGTNLLAPSPRTGHAVVPAPNGSMVFVVGGATSTGATNDVFVLSPFGFVDPQQSEMINVAQGRASAMSSSDSLYSTRGAGAAVDGVLLTNAVTVAAGNPATCACNWCAMTTVGPAGNLYGGNGSNVGTSNPWWGVDLGTAQQVDFVYLYMRSPSAAGGQYTYDFPYGKSAGAQLYAANSNSTPAVPCPLTAPFSGVAPAANCPYTSTGTGGCPPGTTLQVSGGCLVNTNLGAEVPDGGPNIYATPGLVSRFVWLELPGAYRILALCEFQAWQKKPWIWRKLSGTYNAALSMPTTQSSTLSGFGDGDSSRAVDGLLTNFLTNALPYTMSATKEGGDVPFAWWQVDLGQAVDVFSFTVYGNLEATAAVKNTGISWYVGFSEDYKFNTPCTLAPADITPPLTSCTTGPSVVGQLGVPSPTACYRSWACPARGRYVQAVKAAGNVQSIMLGEVQVTANKLLNTPSARTGMAVATYGGCMVLFGGADASGFRNNEVRFFDMLQLTWLPYAEPVGTLPTARGAAFFSLMPSAVPGTPANTLALFGGQSQTAQLNDVNYLSLPRCAALDTSNALVMNCFHGGSVCYYTCQSWATTTNGAAPVVCQIDGSWRGTVPICAVATPSAPLAPLGSGLSAPQATVSPLGVVTVAWAPPASTGFYQGAGVITSYDVVVKVPEVFENFAAGAFPAPIAPYNTLTLSPGYSYVGGNWYNLLPKLGPLCAPFTVCTTSPGSPKLTTPTLEQGVTNSFDFWGGYLRLEADFNRYDLGDKLDAMTLVRDWPAIVSPQDGWEFEAFIALDVVNIVTTSGQGACLSLVDTSEFAGYGASNFQACIYNNGAQSYSVYLASTITGFTTVNLVTTPFITSYNKGSAAYFRFEYIASEYPVAFRAYWKLNMQEAWNRFATWPSVLNMRNAPSNPTKWVPALQVFNQNTLNRAVGLFSYFRIGPSASVAKGTERFVAGSLASAQIYGLTQGSSYTFTVAAATKAGYGAVSAVSNAVTIPVQPPTSNLALLSQGRPCAMNIYYDEPRNCRAAFDGNFATYVYGAYIIADAFGGYGWMTVDLGAPLSVQLIKLWAIGTYADSSQVWVSTTTSFINDGQRCDPSVYPNPISTLVNRYAQFPCFVIGSNQKVFPIGRYVTFRVNPAAAVAIVELYEMQVWGVAPQPLVSQNMPCAMSSTKGINTCAFALDGRFDTYAQNNDDAPTSGATQGWLRVDLGVPTALSSVKIYARTDSLAAAKSLDNMQVWIGDQLVWNQDVYDNNMFCNASYVPQSVAAAGNYSEFLCVVNGDGLGYKTNFPGIGRYLTIATIGTPSFSIVELQVFSNGWLMVSQGKVGGARRMQPPPHLLHALAFAHSPARLALFFPALRHVELARRPSLRRGLRWHRKLLQRRMSSALQRLTYGLRSFLPCSELNPHPPHSPHFPFSTLPRRPTRTTTCRSTWASPRRCAPSSSSASPTRPTTSTSRSTSATTPSTTSTRAAPTRSSRASSASWRPCMTRRPSAATSTVATSLSTCRVRASCSRRCRFSSPTCALRARPRARRSSAAPSARTPGGARSARTCATPAGCLSSAPPPPRATAPRGMRPSSSASRRAPTCCPRPTRRAARRSFTARASTLTARCCSSRASTRTARPSATRPPARRRVRAGTNLTALCRPRTTLRTCRTCTSPSPAARSSSGPPASRSQPAS